MAATPTCQYTRAYIVSLNDPTSRIKRTTRKLLFYYGLWKPAYARRETFSKLHRQEKFSEQSDPSPAVQSDPSPPGQSHPLPPGQSHPLPPGQSHLSLSGRPTSTLGGL